MIQEETMIDRIRELYEDSTVLTVDGFDAAVIGYDENLLKVVYSSSKMIEILMLDEDMSEEDALEHFYFNIHSAFVGDHTPIYVIDQF